MAVLGLAVLAEQGVQHVLETAAQLLELVVMVLVLAARQLLAVTVEYGLRLPKGGSMDAFIYVVIGVVVAVFVVYVLNTNRRKPNPKPNSDPIPPPPDPIVVEMALAAHKASVDAMLGKSTPDPVVAVVPRRKKVAGTPKTGKKV